MLAISKKAKPVAFPAKLAHFSLAGSPLYVLRAHGPEVKFTSKKLDSKEWARANLNNGKQIYQALSSLMQLLPTSKFLCERDTMDEDQVPEVYRQ